MKLKKLVAQVQDFLDADERKRKEEKKRIKSVLKELRAHEEQLSEQLETATDPAKIEKLKRKKKLAHTQRKKGIAMLKELKKPKKVKPVKEDKRPPETD